MQPLHGADPIESALESARDESATKSG